MYMPGADLGAWLPRLHKKNTNSDKLGYSITLRAPLAMVDEKQYTSRQPQVCVPYRNGPGHSISIHLLIVMSYLCACAGHSSDALRRQQEC